MTYLFIRLVSILLEIDFSNKQSLRQVSSDSFINIEILVLNLYILVFKVNFFIVLIEIH